MPTSKACPFCGSFRQFSGYGLAAGPMGAYTYCDSCDELIAFSADLEGVPPDTVVLINEWVKGLDTRIAEAEAKRANRG